MIYTVTKMEAGRAGRAGRAEGELGCTFSYCALSPDWLDTFSLATKCAFGGCGCKLVGRVSTVQSQGSELDPKCKRLACKLCPIQRSQRQADPLGSLPASLA